MKKLASIITGAIVGTIAAGAIAIATTCETEEPKAEPKIELKTQCQIASESYAGGKIATAGIECALKKPEYTLRSTYKSVNYFELGETSLICSLDFTTDGGKTVQHYVDFHCNGTVNVHEDYDFSRKFGNKVKGTSFRKDYPDLFKGIFDRTFGEYEQDILKYASAEDKEKIHTFRTKAKTPEEQ